LISNPGNNDSPLKLPSDPHNPPCGNVHMMLKKEKLTRRGFGRQNAAKETLGVI